MMFYLFPWNQNKSPLLFIYFILFLMQIGEVPIEFSNEVYEMEDWGKVDMWEGVKLL